MLSGDFGILIVEALEFACELHNGRCIVRDPGNVGEGLWARFTGGRDGTLWDYKAMLDLLGTGRGHPILDELAESVARMKALAEGSGFAE